VEAANSVIARNRDQIQKNVFTQNEEGELIQVIETASEQDEAKRIADVIREQKQMFTYFNRDFALLYRTNAQSRALEDALRRANIKYRIYGGLSFYKRKEIKDAVSYLRLAVNPTDEQSILRVINYPKRGLGDTTLARINAFAGENGLTLWDALLRVRETGVTARIATLVDEFTTLIRSFVTVASQRDAYDATSYIIKTCGILKALHEEKDAESLSRWENVQELMNSAKEWVDTPREDGADFGLVSYLAEVSLSTDADTKDGEEEDVVTLMTIHSAKGLEFKSVFVTGMEESIFPSGMADSQKAFEEERRLFYVAITRAEKRLTLSYAKSRYRFGQMTFNEPSRFLEEIAADYIRRPSQSALRDAPAFIPPSPGFRRPQGAAGSGFRPSPQPSIEGFEPSDLKKLAVGQRVLHQKFGLGTVQKVEGVGDDRRCSIAFEAAGDKVLVLKFAKLQILEG
jgi:DNA helicase-2/ATP-dependent DNA helicase PcrA